ncbi:hypothetical protein CASFOL_039967 [Castilleja foliolosa]|uniref:FHA domain-containing protein n=1 Tax=Castilleja foliolosa TaxID=1961234 RepID=A0ABD3BIH1_9LAMI
MAKEDENSTPPQAFKPIPSPNSARGSPSVSRNDNFSSASRNVKTSKEFIQSVAEKIAAQPFQYSDPDVWGVLTAISEKARKRNQGMNLLLTSSEHSIGRLVDDARFQIIAPAVSAHHCKIYRKRVTTDDTHQLPENCFSAFLKDSSTNGTYLNWEKLSKSSSEAKLHHGDIISISFFPQHDLAYAFVFREVQKSSCVFDGGSLKRKPEEYGAENKRLKGIGIGASDGPISLDDFRSLQRSNTELRKNLENQVATVESLRTENRAAFEKHETELRELKESVTKSYQDQLSQLNQSVEAKVKELAELNKISAEQKQVTEDLGERLSASTQSCIEANEIINSQKASISELKAVLDEERDQRRNEREKASLDMKVALQRVQAEATEEIKRVSDAALRREKEQQEMINKLQEADKERCSLVETLRSKLEDTRQKLVNSENKVRLLEGQVREEQQASASNKKRVEELELEGKRLRKELEFEKSAREEAWAKVSALELEMSAAVRDLDFERRRLKAARERIMLRETQLRAFYSTTEEISSLFAKQQEQLKAMQRTLEDEENYETTSIDMDLNRADDNENRSVARDNNNNKDEVRKSNTTAKDQVESSSDEASVTEKHDCNHAKSQENEIDTQEVDFTGPICNNNISNAKGAFGSDIDPEIGTEHIPETEGIESTERVLETEGEHVKNVDVNNNTNGVNDPMEDTEGGGETIRTADLLASEVAGSWAFSTEPSARGENDSHSPGGKSDNNDDAVPLQDSNSLVAESQHIPLAKSESDMRSKERRALSEMIGIVAPDLREQFSRAVGSEDGVGSEKGGVASDSDTEGCSDDAGGEKDGPREEGSDGETDRSERMKSDEMDEDDDTQEDSVG